MEEYSSLSREQLIDKIEEMKRLNNQLLEEKEQEIGLNFSWSGNLGHWYWDIKANTVTFNPLKITTLGYSMEELPEKVSYQFFTEKLHSEDYPKAMNAMLAHLSGKSDVYEVEYRIRTKDGNYKWYYDRGKITQYNEEGKPDFLAGIVFDITEKKEMQFDLERKNILLAEQSLTDGLTRVKNHRALMSYLEDEMKKADESKAQLSIALFDIDDFKKVNDNYGHVSGDKVLVEIASIMQKNTREGDMLGRYGGEEFMIIFKDTDLEYARIVSERIRKAIADHSFEAGMRVTVSGGIIQYSGTTISEFVNDADINLYAAKKNGKNQVI